MTTPSAGDIRARQIRQAGIDAAYFRLFRELDYLILATPSGFIRNVLTSSNIALLTVYTQQVANDARENGNG